MEPCWKRVKCIAAGLQKRHESSQLVAQSRAAGAVLPHPMVMTRMSNGHHAEVANTHHPAQGFAASDSDVEEMEEDLHRLEHDYV